MTLALLVTIPIAAHAQQRLGGPASAGTTQPAPRTMMPPPETMLALVRTYVLALDHALRTENFSVLHALSGPYLQSRLTPERLSQAFNPLKRERLDLASTAITTPTLAVAPSLTKNGMLWLKGAFNTLTKPIHFEMAFEVVGQEWRLSGMNVWTSVPQIPNDKPASAKVL